jgi:glucose/arabinose dehydrogenase
LKRIIACLALFTAVLSSNVAPAQALPDNARVQTYKGNLNFPVDMAWERGSKRIFFTENNTGKIRVIVDRKLKRTACKNLDVDASQEGGALGIALHPNFKNNHYLYVYWTKRDPLQNRVTRFTVRKNRCRDAKHILSGIRAHGDYHHGGQLEFVRGKLFVSVGDAHDPAEAQDTSSRLGKILRVNPNGSIPASNPFGNAVWSYGHRNPFGLTHKPGSNKIYSTENGPGCNDELNRIKKERNYGWGPNQSCPNTDVDGPNPKMPIKRWSEVVVPTDPTWYRGAFGALSGSLYVGSYDWRDDTGKIWRINLNRRGTRVKSSSRIHTASSGVLDIAKGPGGWLYYLTSSSIRRIVKN